MPSVISPENFSVILEEIRDSKNKLFDFSGTNFELLGHDKITQLFMALNNLPQACTLKLNDCTIGFKDVDPKLIVNLTLGFATTPQLETIELRRVMTSEEILLAIAVSLTRNHAIKNIHVDGHKATPDSAAKTIPKKVCDALRHPTAIVLIDGLQIQNDKSYGQISYVSFFYTEEKNPKRPLDDFQQNEQSPKRRKTG